MEEIILKKIIDWHNSYQAGKKDDDDMFIFTNSFEEHEQMQIISSLEDEDTGVDEEMKKAVLSVIGVFTDWDQVRKAGIICSKGLNGFAKTHVIAVRAKSFTCYSEEEEDLIQEILLCKQ